MFITLEGIEGSGKTTQLKQIGGYFENRGHSCVLTREPGGTGLGEKIRAILLDPASSELVPTAELLLYMADRSQHINTLIKPSLAEGKVVLCDRYFDATIVYQGIARGIDTRLICDLHRIIFNDLKPDITFLLDLAPKIGLARAWKQLENGTRVGIESRFEEETLSFHEKVRAGYLELARQDPERIRVVDGSQDEKQVQMDIRNALTEFSVS
ncbi:MAG: dTMP kinase [Desulfobacterales bacterium]|jgi:dTMP kinase